MFGLSGSHMVVLGIVVLLFGSRRLPELGHSMGQAMRAFKEATEGKWNNPIEDRGPQLAVPPPVAAAPQNSSPTATNG